MICEAMLLVDYDQLFLSEDYFLQAQWSRDSWTFKIRQNCIWRKNAIVQQYIFKKTYQVIDNLENVISGSYSFVFVADDLDNFLVLVSAARESNLHVVVLSDLVDHQASLSNDLRMEFRIHFKLLKNNRHKNIIL